MRDLKTQQMAPFSCSLNFITLPLFEFSHQTLEKQKLCFALTIQLEFSVRGVGKSQLVLCTIKLKLLNLHLHVRLLMRCSRGFGDKCKELNQLIMEARNRHSSFPED